MSVMSMLSPLNVGAAAFTGACLLVGIRLLRLARRTRKLPELLIGFSILAGGALTFPLSAVLRHFQLPEVWVMILGTIGRAAYASAAVAMAIVAWRVFRPSRPWAAMVVGSLITVNLLYVVRPFVLGDLLRAELVQEPFYWITTAAQILPWAWVAGESFHLYQMLQRRARVGLGKDSGLIYRMLLWSIGLGSVVLMSISLELTSLMAVLGSARIPLSPFVVVFGLVCAVSFWLAFFPPAALLPKLEEGDSGG